MTSLIPKAIGIVPINDGNNICVATEYITSYSDISRYLRRLKILQSEGVESYRAEYPKGTCRFAGFVF